MMQVNVNDLTEIITEQTIELHMLKKAYNQLAAKCKELEDQKKEEQCEEK